MDRTASHANYERRMRALEDEFGVFEGAWMTTVELYSTVDNIEEGSEMDCFAGVLLRLVRSKGIACKGITSERKLRGEYICQNLLGEQRENERLVYIGKYSYFSGHHARSIFSPIAADNVYFPDLLPARNAESHDNEDIVEAGAEREASQ